MRRTLTFVSIATILIQVLLTIGGPQPINAAARNVFPNDTNSPDSMAVVARVGAPYQLDATEVSFRIFVPVATTGNVTVTIQDACFNRTWGDWASVFELWRGTATEEPLRDEDNGNNLIPDTLQPYLEFSTANCVTNDVVFTISGSILTASTVSGHEAYKTLVLKGHHVGSGGGINGFNVIVSNAGAKVVHREVPLNDVATNGVPLSYQSFATLSNNFPGPQPGDPDYPTAEDNYTFNFAPSCDYSSSVAYIKWSDADYNGPNEDGDIAFQLIDETTGIAVPLDIYDAGGALLATSVTTVSGNNIGGDQAGNSGSVTPFRSAGFAVDPSARYSWNWTNVQERNGVQLWMPFSEMNYSQNCPSPVGYDGQDYSSCTTIAGWLANTVDPSEQLRLRVSTRIQGVAGSYGWQDVTANQAVPTSSVAGDHGFSVPLHPTTLAAIPSGSWTLVYTVNLVDGSGNEVPNSFPGVWTAGKTLSCGSAPASTDSCNYGSFSWSFSAPDSYDTWAGGNFYMHLGGGGGGSPAGQSGSRPISLVSGTNPTYVRATGVFNHYQVIPEVGYWDGPGGPWVVLVPEQIITGTHNVGTGLGTYGPCAWQYQLNSNATPPNSTPTYFPKPGETISATGSVQNNGWGGGPGYEINTTITGPGAPYVTPSTKRFTGAGLAGSSTPGGGATSRAHNFGSWTVATNAPHGQGFCINITLSPTAGVSHPTISPGSGSETDQFCYTIFNLRFDINDDVPMSFVPDNIFPGDNSNSTDEVSVTYNVANQDQGELSAQYPGAIGGPAYGLTYSVSVGGTSGATLVSHTQPNTSVPGGLPWGSTAQGFIDISVPRTALPGQTVCVSITITPERGYSIETPAFAREAAGSVVVNQTCEKVGEQPYIEIHGADAWAGGQWDPDVEGGFWCTLHENPLTDPPVVRSTATAFIKTARRGTIGAFVTHAATALDSIEEFATTYLENEDLTFQNSTTPLGFYNTEGRCVVDYYEYLSKSGVGVGVYVQGDPIAQTGQFFAGTGNDITLSGGNMGLNQLVLLVDGDVTINGNITYGNYSLTDPSQTPFFMVVATGNIDIAQGVTELDGVYISRSVIDTCFNASTRLSINVCPQQLTIRGLFIADDVQFRRTFSGVVRNSTDATEQGSEFFDFSPEVYIAEPPFVSIYQRNYKVDQVKDLPPVY